MMPHCGAEDFKVVQHPHGSWLLPGGHAEATPPSAGGRRGQKKPPEGSGGAGPPAAGTAHAGPGPPPPAGGAARVTKNPAGATRGVGSTETPQRSGAFEDTGDTLATADTHRDEAVLAADTLQLVQRLGGDEGA